MKNWKSILCMTLALALLCGCRGLYVPQRVPDSQRGPDPVPITTREPAPTAEPEPVVLEQVTANELVLRLLESECVQHPDDSVILSPLSIEMALGMAANGADGAAAEAIRTLLGMDPARLNAMLGAYMKKNDATLSIANSMWFSRDLDSLVRQDFKDALAKSYAAGEGTFDPYSAVSAGEINGWVKEKTHGKIDSIVSADNLTEETLALLINALYFNGKWTDPFEDWEVSDGKFRAPGGDQEAKFMCQWLKSYFENDLAVGFSKEYEDGYEFVAILPKDENLSAAALLGSLDIESFLDSQTRAYDVDIKLPKFELEYSASLTETLRGLGLGSLFDGGSLNGMLTDGALDLGWEAHVSDVIHKTYMKMYEEGTEAAAVTAVIVECTSAVPAPRETRQVYLDRPFAFLIRDTGSGQVVFCGAINGVE